MTSSNDSKSLPDSYKVNAAICRLVERYPCMYDRAHPQYMKKDVVDKAWQEISKEMDDSIQSCKVRWRNIRSSFARSINVNKKPASANRSKPYYLHDELSFLTNYITPGIPVVSKRENSLSSSCYSQDDEESVAVAVTLGEESFDYFAANKQEIEEDDDGEDRHDRHGMKTNFNCNDNDTTLAAEINQSEHKRSANELSQDSLQRSHTESGLGIQNDSMALSLQQQQQQSSSHLDQPSVFTTMPNICSFPPKKRQRTLEMFKRSTSEVPETEHEHERDVKPCYCGGTVELNEQMDFDYVFLKGLLPELRAMDFHQKVEFKRRIYEIIANIFDK